MTAASLYRTGIFYLPFISHFKFVIWKLNFGVDLPVLFKKFNYTIENLYPVQSKRTGSVLIGNISHLHPPVNFCQRSGAGKINATNLDRSRGEWEGTALKIRGNNICWYWYWHSCHFLVRQYRDQSLNTHRKKINLEEQMDSLETNLLTFIQKRQKN